VSAYVQRTLPDGRPVLWEPFPGSPQVTALRSPAFEILFGGSAGGGKSAVLVAAPLRYVHEPSFVGIIFRKTFPEAQKLNLEECTPLYTAFGAVPNKAEGLWKFPSGARIYISHMGSDEDAHRHQGAQYQYVGWDELTHYSLYQYRYLFSRLRSKHGLRCQVFATCNPEPGWVKDRFGPWVDPEYDGEHAESGEVRWFIVDKDGVEQYVPRGTPNALSRTFVRARLSDNPILVASPAYEANLRSLDIVQRSRLLDGDWTAGYAEGLMFRREFFRLVRADEVPKAAIRVRSWDLAATEVKLKRPGDFRAGAKNDPDFTVGSLYGWTPQPFGLPDTRPGFFLEDVVRFQGRPEIVRSRIFNTAAMDAKAYGARGVCITLPQDPGQAGKDQADNYAQELSNAGYWVEIETPSGAKTLRASPVSATAEHSGIAMVVAPWNQPFIAEAEQFPKGNHDDQIDTVSDAHKRIGIIRARLAARAGQSDLPDMS
jgi:predicted phage terminase large subunit-like protein